MKHTGVVSLNARQAKQSVTVGAQLLWGSRYGCSNGRCGWTIVMSYIEINKAVSQWLLTFNLCVSVTWPLTCAFHIPCTQTPEIIDVHRGVCDKCGIQIEANRVFEMGISRFGGTNRASYKQALISFVPQSNAFTVEQSFPIYVYGIF